MSVAPDPHPARGSSTSPSRIPWTALFIASPSPGAIFRFLERPAGRLRDRRAELAALDLRVTEAAGPDARRGLVTVSADPAAFRAWAEARAPEFAAAFTSAPVLLFRIDPTAWGLDRWEAAGSAPDRSEHPISSASPSAWQRLLRVAATPVERTAAEAWAEAKQLGLPLHVFPPVRRQPGGRRDRTSRAEEIDYAIVSRLDQKGLLEESTSRLYRFAF
jgi:hypothetical protein